MNVAVTRLRSRLGAALAMLAALALAALLLNHSAATAPADQNPSNMSCYGHTAKGKPDPDDPTSGVVEYTFACSQPITGYSLLPDHQATSYETEVFAFDPKTKEVVPTDAFSCNGDLPGWGINCTGSTSGSWHSAQATFTIDGNVCKEPRVDPLVVVMYASSSKDKVTQYIAGPFDLGRPLGCPKSKVKHKLRIPRDEDESTIAPAPVS